MPVGAGEIVDNSVDNVEKPPDGANRIYSAWPSGVYREEPAESADYEEKGDEYTA